MSIFLVTGEQQEPDRNYPTSCLSGKTLRTHFSTACCLKLERLPVILIQPQCGKIFSLHGQPRHSDLNAMPNIVAFVEGDVCMGGKLHRRSLYVSTESGCIVDGRLAKDYEIHNLHGQIIAPAFLELQTNGCAGFHFTNFENSESYRERLENVSRFLVTCGVGSFWATIPTVSTKVFKNVSLSSLLCTVSFFMSSSISCATLLHVMVEDFTTVSAQDFVALFPDFGQ